MKNSRVHITIQLFAACDWSCAYCEVVKRRKEYKGWTLEELQRILEPLSKTNHPITLVLSGGEACLHPEFLDICKWGKKLKWKVGVISHSGHSVRETIMRSSEVGLDLLVTSIDLPRGIKAIPGTGRTAPEETWQTLDTLVSVKDRPRILVNTVLNKQTLPTINILASELHAIGVDGYQCSIMRGASPKNPLAGPLDAEEVMQIRKLFKQIRSEYGDNFFCIPETYEDQMVSYLLGTGHIEIACTAGRQHFYLTSNKVVRPCYEFDWIEGISFCPKVIRDQGVGRNLVQSFAEYRNEIKNSHWFDPCKYCMVSVNWRSQGMLPDVLDSQPIG